MEIENDLVEKISKSPAFRFASEIRTVACLPEANWSDAYESICADFEADGIEIPGKAAEQIFASYQDWYRAKNMLLGRAVQPTGPLHELAPAVGAVRLADECSDRAKTYLSERMILAIEKSEPSTIDTILKFCREKLGEHRNYRVWVAINALTFEGDVNKRRNDTRERFQRSVDSMPSNPNRRELIELYITAILPDSKTVRKYVTENKEGFPGMPLDDRGWTRVWHESGAGLLIEKATRGKSED